MKKAPKKKTTRKAPAADINVRAKSIIDTIAGRTERPGSRDGNRQVAK